MKYEKRTENKFWNTQKNVPTYQKKGKPFRKAGAFEPKHDHGKYKGKKDYSSQGNFKPKRFRHEIY